MSVIGARASAFQTPPLPRHRAWDLAVAAVGVAAVYLVGLGVDLMDRDATQYAAIAREMMERGQLLEVTDRGEAYLDKPPLLFWVSQLSFRVLGVSNLSYKLPSFVGFLLGLIATYRLAALYSGRRAGWLTALILATCQGSFLMNVDVRTDTLVTGLVAFSLWQAAAFLETRRMRNATLMGVGVGLGMLAKGPLALAIPVLAVGSDVAAKRKWRRIARWEWVWVAVVAGLLLVPMCVGLYRQHGLEGVRFHLWGQGFGRLVGENIWADEHGPFFLVPHFLWIVLPWSLVLFVAFGSRLRELARGGMRLGSGAEALTLGAFALGFVGLSLSRSKLPHYLYVLLPSAAVITGTWLAGVRRTGIAMRWLRNAQTVLLLSICAFMLLLLVWLFPLRSPALWILIGFVGAFIVWRGRSGSVWTHRDPLLLASVLTIAAANLALSAHIYPRLLPYQSTSVAGRLLAERDIPPGVLYMYRSGAHGLDFYARSSAIHTSDLALIRDAAKRSDIWIYTNDDGLERIEAEGMAPHILQRFRHFHVSRLTPRFLNPTTRDDATRGRVLLQVRRLSRPAEREPG